MGIVVTINRSRMGEYVVTATDNGQAYRLMGNQLYPMMVELSRQVGVEDME